MSQLSVNAIDKESGSTLTLGGSGTTVNIGASGQTTNVTGKLDASNADFVPKNPLSNRNLLINGAMQVAQRGTSFTGIGGSAGTYSCDRWRHGFTATTARCTLSQDTNAPNGFSNSLKVSITTAEASLNAASGCGISQPIEGQNLQMLAKGTADAKQVTVSFWVKTNKTGTYQFELQDSNNARNQVLSYTVNAADTWEYKTATFAGDTTGAFQNDAGASAYLQFFLFGGTNYTSGTVQSTWGSRSNANLMSPTMPNLADSTSNYWQITGIQLEVGSVATPFEHESYGQTFAKCQRYYEKSIRTCYIGLSGWLNSGTGVVRSTISFNTFKRASPTMSYLAVSANWSAYNISVSSQGFGPELATGTTTTDARPGFQWVAESEL